jgi:hypothetical protein
VRAILLGGLGLLAWLASQAIAIALASGGHGWGPPFFLSAPLVVLYPATFIRAFGLESQRVELNVVILVIAAVLDLLLLVSLFIEDFGSFYEVWKFDDGWKWEIAWLLLWAGWQALAVAALCKRRTLTSARQA